MRRLKHQSLAANLNVKLAYSFVSYINRKVRATLRPSNSNTRPITASFYVNNNTKDILGCEALIGLKQLKQFNLSIMFINEQVVVYHEDKPIGFQPVSFGYGLAQIKADDRLDNITTDTNLSGVLNKYKSVFTNLDSQPISGTPMRFITVHQRPIFAKLRHYTPDEIQAMDEHIKGLLAKDLIEPSNSGYAATSRIIRKKMVQAVL